METRHIILWPGLFMLACLALGCGKKTRPVPPQEVFPERITDLARRLDPEELTLSWSWPGWSSKGGRIRYIDEFIVERAVYPLTEYCGDCPLRYKEVARVPAGMLPIARGSAKVTYHESGLIPGYHYSYRVRSSLGWPVISPPSNSVEFGWQTPLNPPGKLMGFAGDRRVRLNWQPVSEDINGRPVSGDISYRIERAEAAGVYSVIAEGQTVSDYTDHLVDNGRIYRYRLRAERSDGSVGLFSQAVEFTPRDLTPPPPPRGISAIKTPNGIRLHWEPVAASDLAGYRLFRRVTREASLQGEPAATPVKDFTMIGEIHGAAGYVDRDIPRLAQTVQYAVRSYDQAEPANIGPFSRAVTVEINRE